MILYFSGTGNSLSVAKRLAALTGDTALHVSDLMGDCMKIHDERIGLVFPVYFFDMPDPVRVFMEYTRFNPSSYFYAIATCGGTAGNALYNLKELLAHKNCRLAYGKVIKMPSSSTIASRKNIKYKLQYLEQAEPEIAVVAQAVRKKENNSGKIKHSLTGSVFGIGLIGKKAHRYFSVSIDPEICVRCGICEQICPNNNIHMDESGVTIGQDCSHCLSCVHWCPSAAVKIHGKMVQASDQYHNPEIALTEMYRR